jgi:Tetratrico peptide repeat
VTVAGDDWERRVAEAWASFGSRYEQDSVALIDGLPVGDPAGLYERASARDAVGVEAEAVPLYRRALAAGLPAYQRAVGEYARLLVAPPH